MVYLSQAKTYAFHLPYREGKFVYFICLVLNLVWSPDATISLWWACKDFIWHFEIGSGREDVKSSPKDIVLFLVVLYHSRWLKSLSTLDVIAILTSRSFPIPFCTSRLYIVLCRCHGAWNRERWKIWLLAQNRSSLVPWRIKVNLEALPYQYQTNRFSPNKKVFCGCQLCSINLCFLV